MTLAAIAEQVGDGWQGVRVFNDGEPERTGYRIWHDVQETFKVLAPREEAGVMPPERYASAAEAERQYALQVHRVWENFFDRVCQCHRDGWWPPMRQRDPIIYERNGGKCGHHCYPPLFQWVYVIVDAGLAVLATVGGKLYAEASGYPGFTLSTGAYDAMDTYLRHVMLAFYPWDGEEPDWQGLHQLREARQQIEPVPDEYADREPIGVWRPMVKLGGRWVRP